MKIKQVILLILLMFFISFSTAAGDFKLDSSIFGDIKKEGAVRQNVKLCSIILP